MTTLTTTKKRKVSYSVNNRVFIKQNEFNKLEFIDKNRPVDQKQVDIIKKSILAHGCTRLVILVFNPKTKKYIVLDGQHLAHALFQLGMDIEATVITLKDENHLIEIMIDHNTTAKVWNTKNFINTWAKNGNVDYLTLQDKLKETKLQLGILLMAYTFKNRVIASTLMKQGKFTITDKQRSETLIQNILEYRKHTPNTRQVNEALMLLMLDINDFNHKQMLTRLSQKKHTFSTKEGEIYEQLINIYYNK